jgi:hypothetical protein
LFSFSSSMSGSLSGILNMVAACALSCDNILLFCTDQIAIGRVLGQVTVAGGRNQAQLSAPAANHCNWRWEPNGPQVRAVRAAY